MGNTRRAAAGSDASGSGAGAAASRGGSYCSSSWRMATRKKTRPPLNWSADIETRQATSRLLPRRPPATTLRVATAKAHSAI